MKRFYTMYLASAFADKPFTGNSTGIIIAPNELKDEEMQNIASDLNQSVNVFVKALDTDIYVTRFFTPEKEIELCGHASIATFFALAQNEYIKPIKDGIKKIKQHTKNGKVSVEILYEHYKPKRVFLILPLKDHSKDVDIDSVCKALNLNREDIGLKNIDVLPQKISTGLSDIIVPVKSKEILSKINLNEEFSYEYSKNENIISLNVISTEDGENIEQRTFSPIIGVKEESGSGTSTAATYFYLMINDLLKSDEIKLSQGSYLKRESKVSAKYCKETNKVKVGGVANVFMNGVLNI